MPRELGKAKRADITGRFPGDQAEHGSAFARFLEDSGQLSPVQDGSRLIEPPHGSNGTHTEIPGHDTRSPGSDTRTPGSETDTEIGLESGDLVHPSGGGSFFDTAFDDDALMPEVLSPEPAQPDDRPESTGELQPVDWEPSADTIHPDQPRALDSLPDLTSPELDDEQEDSEILDETDKLPPRPRRGSIPTVKPEPHEISNHQAPAGSGDTGILEPANPAPERIDMAELDPDGEDDTGITIEAELNAGERITSKVDTYADGVAHERSTAMRDTVNFYNQTQNLYEDNKRQGGTGAKESVLDPIGERDTRPLERIPDVDSEDEKITRPLKTVAQSEGPGGRGGDERDTQKFHDDDRRPQHVQGGEEFESLEPVADPKMAFGRDTQRFYVAEVLSGGQPSATGDTTADLQPAHEGLPSSAQSGADSTLPDMATESGRGMDTDGELPEPAKVDADFLPAPEEAPSERIIPEYASLEPVGEDRADDATDSNRITTRVDSSPLVGRDTDRPGLNAQPDGSEDQRTPSDRTPVVPVPVPARISSRARHLTESLARRLREERAETRRMIEQAESVVVKLREAAEQSRNDLVALSERRAAMSAGGNGQDHRPPEQARDNERGGTTLYDPPAHDEFATAIVDHKPTQQPEQKLEGPAHSRRDRVPTRAVGDMVNELERTARKPASLSTLLDSISQRNETPEVKKRASRRHRDEDDSDLLLAVSERMRATMRRELETESGEADRPRSSPDEPERRTQERPADESHHADNVRSSRLSQDLDRLWRVLDARRMPAVVMPPSERARPARRDEDDGPEGWTQEALWGTLVGIAGVTFILGGLFVWVLFKLLT